MSTGNARTYRLFFAALLAGVSFAVYWSTLSNGFVYDDNFQILKNPWIRGFSRLPEMFTTDSYGFMEEGFRTNTYRPMLFTVYGVEYALFGLKPWGWHLFNVMFHAANSVMVFFTLSLLLKGEAGEAASRPYSSDRHAFAGALIFTVHPANGEAVAWVGCVPELLYTLLCLASFYLYVATVSDGKGGGRVFAGRSLSVFFFFAAAFFKETAAALPLFIFVYDCLVKKDERVISAGKVKRYLPYFLAGVAYLVIRYHAIGGMAPGYRMHAYLSGFQKLLNIFPLFVKYLWTLILPLSYHPIQPLDPVFSLFETRAALSVLITLGLSSAVFMFRKKLHPLFLFSFSIIIIPLIPGLYAYSVSITPFSDRYLYFPTIGFALAVSLASRELPLKGGYNGSRGAAAFFIAVAVFYALISAGRGAVWRDDLSLWSASYGGSRDNYIAVYSLGDIYLKKGLTDEALVRLDEALRLNKALRYPDSSTMYLTRKALAEAYDRKGRYDDLMSEYTEILRIKPGDAFASYNLAVMYQARGFLKESIELYRNALASAVKPRHRRDILNNIGVCYAGMGMPEEAVANYREALKYSPGDPVVLNNIKAATDKGGR